MASLKEILAELRQVEIDVLLLAAEINLVFTTASEVQQQILTIQLVQNKLNQIKQGLQKRQSDVGWEVTWQSLVNSTGKTFSEEVGAALADSLLGLDPVERRKRLQREQGVLRTQIQTKLSHTIPALIEQHVKRGDQLVALGYEYLKNPSKVNARLRAEKQRLQAEKQKRLRVTLFICAVVSSAMGLFLLVSIAKGWIHGSEIFAFLIVLLGLIFFVFKIVKRDLERN